MKATPDGHGSWRYLWLMIAVLAGLWIAAGSASAVSPTGNEPGVGAVREPPLRASAHTAPGNLTTPADTPTSVLVAHVTWQGIPQPNHRNTTETLTLTLRLNSGGPYLEYPIMDTDASGFYTVSVDSLPAGTYNYRAKGFRNLSNGGSVTLAGEPVTNVEMGLMRAGDAISMGPTNYDVVNVTDFSLLKALFGCPPRDRCYDARADFNNTDNVDATDFALMKGNFGQAGAPPVSP